MQFLTSPGDLVLDPFAGSNTTGAICEQEGRRWLACELREEYLAGSRFKFLQTGRTSAEEVVAGEEHLGLPLFRK